MIRKAILAAVVFIFVGGCFAQVGEAPEAVVDAARAAQRAKVKAKFVLNDDTVRATRSGIPDISRARDNSDDIATAILKFDETHTPAQTEEKARDWYAEQDSALERISTEMRGIVDDSWDRCESADERDESACQRAMQLRAQHNQTKRNELQRAFWHMNSTLRSVRYRLMRKHLIYDWMVERELYTSD